MVRHVAAADELVGHEVGFGVKDVEIVEDDASALAQRVRDVTHDGDVRDRIGKVPEAVSAPLPAPSSEISRSRKAD